MADAHLDELRIGAVSAARGRIGMTICPGRNAQGPEFNYNRDLDQDLPTIVDWGASAIVSVIEQSELDRFSVSNLGLKAEARGLDWYHLPVVDVRTPGPDFEALWVYAGHRLRRALAAGKNVLVHCRGGLGRTGTLAARLLIELGDAADDAIGKVREARPGAIETPQQERYVRGCRRAAADDSYADRVLGCMLGGAVGDALGYAVEFDSWPSISRRYGVAGIRDLGNLCISPFRHPEPARNARRVEGSTRSD